MKTANVAKFHECTLNSFTSEILGIGRKSGFELSIENWRCTCDSSCG